MKEERNNFSATVLVDVEVRTLPTNTYLLLTNIFIPKKDRISVPSLSLFHLSYLASLSFFWFSVNSGFLYLLILTLVPLSGVCTTCDKDLARIFTTDRLPDINSP
jgi:hypothetical protein